MRSTMETERPEKTLVVITTDGMENSSCEYSKEKVKTLVERMQSEYGWEFIFLGANIDSIKTAGGIGIGANRTANYHADHVGTAMNFNVVANVVSQLRTKRSVSDDWKDEIDRDYTERK